MKFIDLFAGIGGFRLGMEAAGHECVAFCEIDKFARKSYKAIHDTEGEVEMHDITTVSDESVRGLGDIDIICGGFPCQAFSIAGKRRGFEDTRGTLFFEIARFASVLRPSYLFLENVKGLLNHERGATFETILRALDELGYDVEWQVLNSKHYVPQNRERVFIIGHLRGERTGKVFPFARKNKAINENDIKPINNTKKVREQLNYDSINRFYDPDGIAPCLDTMGGGNREPKILVESLGNINPSGNGMNGEVYSSQGLSPTLTTNKGEGLKIIQKPRGYNKGGTHDIAPTLSSSSWQENNLLSLNHIALPVLTPDREKKRQNGRRVKEDGDPSFTLTAQDRHGVYDGSRIRKLTPRECWRLQGFPDWAFDRAKEVNSDSQLYKQAGNSVTVPVIYDIARRLKGASNEN